MFNEFEDCDGALWHIDVKTIRDEVHHDVLSTIYNYEDRTVKPDDLGYKYHILTYKEDLSEAEVISAYIGDVGFFISNHARAGYNGMLVKDKIIPKKDIKLMFRKILENWQFSPNVIKTVIKQV